MKEIKIFVLIVLVCYILLSNGTASETVNVGNYSFTFNITVPYQIQPADLSSMPTAVIKTFDGQVALSDLSWSNFTIGDHVGDDFYYLGFLEKNVAGEGNKIGDIYAISFGYLRFHLVFDAFDIQSTLNLTQSIDFFRDVEIARIRK